MTENQTDDFDRNFSERKVIRFKAINLWRPESPIASMQGRLGHSSIGYRYSQIPPPPPNPTVLSDYRLNAKRQGIT